MRILIDGHLQSMSCSLADSTYILRGKDWMNPMAHNRSKKAEKSSAFQILLGKQSCSSIQKKIVGKISKFSIEKSTRLGMERIFSRQSSISYKNLQHWD